MVVDANEFEAWIKTQGNMHPSVDFADVGKVAQIVDTQFVDTKYGRRLRVDLQFDDGEKKVIFLSKSKARTLLDYFRQRDPALTKPELWVGKKVRIERVNVMVGGQMKETLIILPAE